jgi:TM2 domain-containing membrane protein YozV
MHEQTDGQLPPPGAPHHFGPPPAPYQPPHPSSPVVPAQWSPQLHGYEQRRGVVPAKSPGVAVLLTFLWLGAGHLYAGRTGTGVALLVYGGLLWLLCLTLIGALIGVPLWLVSVPLAMVMAARAARDSNARNGIVVR